MCRGESSGKTFCMRLKDIAEKAGLNLQGVQKQFPEFKGKLNEMQFTQVLDYYLGNPKIAEDKKEKLRAITKPAAEFNPIYLACVISLISIQAWHFMAIASEAAALAGREPAKFIDYLMGFLFESVAILITIDSKQENRQSWLYLFAFLAFITNSVYYKLFTEFSLYQTTGKFMASIALPVAILAFSHLFQKTYKV